MPIILTSEQSEDINSKCGGFDTLKAMAFRLVCIEALFEGGNPPNDTAEYNRAQRELDNIAQFLESIGIDSHQFLTEIRSHHSGLLLHQHAFVERP